MVNFANKSKETPLENGKILTFQEIKCVILLWDPITTPYAVVWSPPNLSVLVLVVTTIYGVLH